MPFFSVIIPAYNRSKVIKETIGSVINQKFTDWECIIVDDGSTDNTVEIVREIIKMDHRISYYYQENAERSVARNNGVSKSTGRYICFLDSDDLYEADHLENLHTCIIEKAEPVGLFFTDQKMLIGDLKEKVDTVNYDHSSDFFIKHSVIPARVCIHRHIFTKFSFNPKIVIVEDSVLWTQISTSFPIHHIAKDSVVYRWHEDNSVNIKNNCFLPRLKGLRILFTEKEIKNRISRKLRKEAISNCYYGIAKYYAYKKRFFPMLLNIMRSILLDIQCKQNKAKIYMIYEYFR